MKLSSAAFLLVVMVPARAWFDGDGGLTLWDHDCTWFYCSGIGGMDSTSDQCGGICIAEPDCTHFYWYQPGATGLCYLKNTYATEQRCERGETVPGHMCGYVKSRVNKI